MSSVAQPEFVKAQQKRAKEARERAQKLYSRFYGQEEGEKRLDLISRLMQQNMRSE